MALGIGPNGIVRQDKDGEISLLRVGRNDGIITEAEVPVEFADAYRLAPGDIVEGEFEPLRDWTDMSGASDVSDTSDVETQPDWDSQPDPGNARYHVRDSSPRVKTRRPRERLLTVRSINGLDLEEAEERPSARTKRSQSERTPPDRLLTIADGPDDESGRLIDFAAPLGAGVFGIVYGPHGAGLTWTLQSALRGISKNAPDAVLIALLLRPRAEEATEWRRRVPDADVIVGRSSIGEPGPSQTLEICALVLESAQRMTELGRDVVLVVDSLTALWAALLEVEEADAQFEADNSSARNRIREWTQKAGCFHGQAPLGGGCGGSLTILGSIWNQAIDIEAEEERDTHPHLRLLEHVLPEAAWIVALSETLKQSRFFPAVNIDKSRSQYEERILPLEITEPLFKARGYLPRKDPVQSYLRVIRAIERSRDTAGLIEALDVRAEAVDSVPEEASAGTAFFGSRPRSSQRMTRQEFLRALDNSSAE